ncbi:MAG: hypothetical protein IK142_04310, partial [Clostridiales bacterium]|nr:hypothetical protein [Clostridiales bacterium]
MAEVTTAKVKKPSAINKRKNPIYMAIIYIVCIILLIICLMPFWLLLVNATRSSVEIQTHAISLIPSKYLMSNWKVFQGKDFNVAVGFKNSLLISASATALAVYFSSLTAYALTAYEWK